MGVLGDVPLPVGEIIPKHELFDYECKYMPGMSDEIFPAKLDARVARRFQELALAAAFPLEGAAGILFFSAGTDGTDGPTDAAGAVSDGQTIPRGRAAGLDPARHFAENDAYPFFRALGDLVVTGPTRTNVMDVHLLLSGPREAHPPRQMG